MSYTVREARMSDIQALTGLLGQLYRIETRFTPNAANQEKALRMCLDRPDYCRIIVAESGGDIAGMANLQLSVSTAEGRMSAHIDDFVIHERHRGKGVGQALFEAAREIAADADASRLTVNVDIDNGPGLKFFRKMGFESLNLMRFKRPL